MIKMLVMDVDGTLTDGKIYMSSNGECVKVFNIKDGLGIREILLPAGIIPVIITGRSSTILEKRCQELGITELYQGVTDKKKTLFQVMKNNNISAEHVAYIGDDINDLPCMLPIREAGGLIGCPTDAVEKVKNNSDFIAFNKGGDGAVREFIDHIMKEDTL